LDQLPSYGPLLETHFDANFSGIAASRTGVEKADGLLREIASELAV